MKTHLFAIALFVTCGTLASPPVGYYATADGKAGNELRAALHQIIRMLAGYTNIQLIVMTQLALARNHDIAEKLGVLTDVGLNDMRRGQSPTIKVGKYKDDELSVDHIVPRAVAPELDNVIANLELMPLRMNKSKSAKMGARQYDFAKKFRVAGLLSETRLDEVLSK